MQKGDVISLSFTGKETDSGKVFDTTHLDIAKKEGLKTNERKYGPVTVIIGAGELLSGIDDALLGMKNGEQKTISLSPEKAFGNRDAQLIKILPLNEFKKHNVPAVPGTIVNANDMLGKVQSVSGGRVRVDFNPELAGKEVTYELKIEKQFTDEKEKLDALAEKMFPWDVKPAIQREKDSVTVSGPIPIMTRYQRSLAIFSKLVLESIPTVKKVNLRSEIEKKDVENAHVHDDGTIHSNEEHSP
ncbi:MAG: peptidylprolyl isomerase [Candidatus Diapherotrites archaeon]